MNEDNYVVCKFVSTNTKYDGLTVVVNMDQFMELMEETDLRDQMPSLNKHHPISEF